MQNFEDYLIEKYPDLFPKDENGKPRYSDCGISCPFGWQDLVDGLCSSIDWRVKNNYKYEITNKFSLSVYRFIWNRLRIGLLLTSIERFIDPVDWESQKIRPYLEVEKIRSGNFRRTKFLKSFQFFRSNISPRAKFEKISITPVVIGQVKQKKNLRFYYNGGDKIIQGMVIFAEILSNSICEETGGKGYPCFRDGWYRTLSEKKMNELGYKPTNQ